MNFCSDPLVKLRSLLLTALMRVPPAQDHELSENLFKRGAIVAPEIGTSTASNSRPNRSSPLSI
jgi:hypothetical protein